MLTASIPHMLPLRNDKITALARDTRCMVSHILCVKSDAQTCLRWILPTMWNAEDLYTLYASFKEWLDHRVGERRNHSVYMWHALRGKPRLARQVQRANMQMDFTGKVECWRPLYLACLPEFKCCKPCNCTHLVSFI